MLGAILGDIIGSVYEVQPVKHKDFEFFVRGSGFTDDTALTVAVAEHILTGKDLVTMFHDYFAKYPHAGYGRTFGKWAKIRDPYNSWGNGSAMRVSPVGWAYDDKETVMKRAAETSAVTHDHRDAIVAAQSVAVAIFMARTGSDKHAIRDAVARIGSYNMDRTLAEIRPNYKFEVYAIYSVSEAIIAFLESDSYEDAIRNAISLGGDADTQACIAGSIAEAYYGEIPSELSIKAFEYLDESMKDVVLQFIEQYISPKMKE